MRKDWFNTAVQFALIIFGFILLVLISAGIRFEFERLKDLDFWFDVLLRLAITLILFNLVFSIDLKNRRGNKQNRYYYVMATKQMKIKHIKDNNLFEDLGKAVDEENQERYEQRCTYLLHKVSVRIAYEDLPKEKTDMGEWLAEIKEKFLLSDKDLRRVKKVALKILNGKVKIQKLTADDVLNFLGEEKSANKPIVFNSADEIRNINCYKTLTFMFSVAAMTVLSYEPTWTDVIYNIVVNFSLLSGAAVSGGFSAGNFLRKQTEVLERQNNMLVKRMGIMTEYSGE